MGESECRRLSDEVRSIVAELNKMPFGGQTGVGSVEGIEGYLQRPVNQDRARQRERASSGSAASSSSRPSSEVPPPGEIVGRELVKWHLADVPLWQEPRRSMTPKEIEALRINFRIPSNVVLRPLRDGELATNPPAGWVAVHEHQFKCGLTLPLHPWVQRILSDLDLAVGQITPNMWKQLLGCTWFGKWPGNGWPTLDEVLSSLQAGVLEQKVLLGYRVVRRAGVVKVDNDPRSKKMSKLGTEGQLLARLMEQARQSKREAGAARDPC
ncbi:hypothetical protein M0R45_000489 [Rubus argutus]|uniref:Uncharacterized protein n=1 Tax=Rubus argutus TaxID=59490 RepID=A0AAW1VLS5_RUBAR